MRDDVPNRDWLRQDVDVAEPDVDERAVRDERLGARHHDHLDAEGVAAPAGEIGARARRREVEVGDQQIRSIDREGAKGLVDRVLDEATVTERTEPARERAPQYFVVVND